MTASLDDADAARNRIRVLFVVEAVTLAHVARSRALAAMLDPSTFDVTFACDDRFDFLFEKPAYRRLPLVSISSTAFSEALDRGRPLYSTDTLEQYVQGDRAAFAAAQPHVVVGDFRLSLSVSARLAGIPYINVTNAGWSPQALATFPVPDILPTRLFGVKAAQWIFDRVRPIAFAAHAAPLNRLRRRHRLAPLPRDLRHAYTDGDRVAFADLPELIPTPGAPSTHTYVGPLLWSPEMPDPDWSADVPEDRPLVYVALGSSGKASLLAPMLKSLSQLPVVVVASTAGQPAPTRQQRLFTAPYLAGDRWARRASIVVCNGGSPTCYQSLAEGVPIVGVPNNLDQFINMAAVQRSGAGLLVRSKGHDVDEARTAIVRMLDQDDFAQKAQRLGRRIREFDSASRFTAMIRATVRVPVASPT